MMKAVERAFMQRLAHRAEILAGIDQHGRPAGALAAPGIVAGPDHGFATFRLKTTWAITRLGHEQWSFDNARAAKLCPPGLISDGAAPRPMLSVTVIALPDGARVWSRPFVLAGGRNRL